MDKANVVMIVNDCQIVKVEAEGRVFFEVYDAMDELMYTDENQTSCVRAIYRKLGLPDHKAIEAAIEAHWSSFVPYVAPVPQGEYFRQKEGL